MEIDTAIAQRLKEGKKIAKNVAEKQFEQIWEKMISQRKEEANYGNLIFVFDRKTQMKVAFPSGML